MRRAKVWVEDSRVVLLLPSRLWRSESWIRGHLGHTCAHDRLRVERGETVWGDVDEALSVRLTNDPLNREVPRDTPNHKLRASVRKRLIVDEI